MQFNTVVVAAVVWATGITLSAQDYDPLLTGESSTSEPIDLQIHDGSREREIPIRIYLPEESQPAPVILFSHGLGGSRRECGYLGNHWSARGHVVVVLQHAGSDESIWKDVDPAERRAAIQAATSVENALARLGDVVAVLDQLEAWSDDRQQRFAGRFDMQRVGMSGHSYGAAITQRVSGQSEPRVGQRYTDERIRAALMLSPGRPRGAEPEVAFGSVSIPWMLMTGTRDTSRVRGTTVEDRRSVYPALPETIDKYELVLHEGAHSAFIDAEQRGRPRNPNHHRVIMALSTAFWDSHLRGDEAARAWLHGDAPRAVMEMEDLWQFELRNADRE